MEWSLSRLSSGSLALALGAGSRQGAGGKFPRKGACLGRGQSRPLPGPSVGVGKAQHPHFTDEDAAAGSTALTPASTFPVSGALLDAAGEMEMNHSCPGVGTRRGHGTCAWQTEVQAGLGQGERGLSGAQGHGQGASRQRELAGPKPGEG